MGVIRREEEAKAMLKGMVASYRTIEPDRGSSLHEFLIPCVLSLKSSESTTFNTVTTSPHPLLISHIRLVLQELEVPPCNHLTILGTSPISNLASIMVAGTAFSTLTPASQLLMLRRRSKP